MTRRLLAILVLFPILLGQQCLEPLPHTIGTPLPWVMITTPDSKPTYSTGATTLDIGGQAFSTAGITEVKWSNDQGGSGTCEGLANWTAKGIALQAGQNVITVTATAGDGTALTDTLTVTVKLMGSRYVAPGVIATLNGSGVLPASGGTITSYQWQQTGGSTVTINNADQVQATYLVPDADQQVLTFELTVRDASGAENRTSVSQTVLKSPSVRLKTTQGDILLTMLSQPLPDGAPATVLNFLQYVEDGFYNGTIFHRLAKDPDNHPFVVQGGGFLPGLTKQAGVRAPVVNEFSPTRSNVRGTVAMAKLGTDPNSATCEFFINMADNSSNLDNQNGGFTVFATVDDTGMAVADLIAQQPTETRNDPSGNPFQDVPVTDIIIKQATLEPLPVAPAVPAVTSVTPSNPNPTLNEVITVTVEVANTGGSSGSFDIQLIDKDSANAWEVQTQPILNQSFTAGQTQSFDFSVKITASKTGNLWGQARINGHETWDGSELACNPQPVEKTTPVASAKANVYVFPGLNANLNGSESTDPNGDSLTYHWEQTAGPTVTINNADQAHATYEVPDADLQNVTFQLTVRNPSGAENTASVTQTILKVPNVRLTTTQGDLLLVPLFQPFPDGAPKTVQNFLQYVEDGFYDGTIFHRVMPDFVVQGGGFLPGLVPQTGLRPPIENEFSPIRSNIRETVAMAKLGDDPNSATSQFFINLADNSSNLDHQNGGFTVFAHIDNLTIPVADQMAVSPTTTRNDPSGTPFENVPVTDIVLTKAALEP